MKRSTDRLLPIAVVIVMAVLAAVVVALLSSATQRGRGALESSLLNEVQAVARSQDQRIASTLGSTAGLAAQPFELTPRSSADLTRLEDLLGLIAGLRTGFFLVDDDSRITQGVQLLSGEIGDRFERPGFDELVASPAFAGGTGGILTVDDGITTNSPTIAIVFPILDPATVAVRGSFVFESEVAADSDLNAEISQLSRGDTGRFTFYDDNGRVLAANDPALLGSTIDDTALLDGPTGLSRRDGDVIVVAEVPSAGWRIAFRQERDEFEANLSGPIQAVGTVVVVVLLAVGAVGGLLLVRRLQAAREEEARLRRLAESQEEFVSIVSHELRTPVAGVLGFLQTTLDHWDAMDEAERRSAVRRAATNARRLQALTRDVLDSDTVEAGRMSFAFTEVDLVEEVESAVDAARALYEGRAFDLEVPAGTVLIQADADRLQQVLTNLLDNATQNAPPSEPIDVRVSVAGDSVEIDVVDRGPGLDEEIVERAFERFVRGRADRIGGTGLGLYIARNIVEAHGGTISVRSTPAGATFTVRLPVASEAATSPH